MVTILPKEIRLVVVGIEGNINLGFIARIAKNFGINSLYLVSPLAKPDSEEALRFAAKATDVLKSAKIVNTLDEALNGVDLSICTSARVGQHHDVLRHAITPWEAVEIAEHFNSVAIVFGRESTGLTRDEIACCDLLLSIPANKEYPVLNLSHAIAIVAYEFFKHELLKSNMELITEKTQYIIDRPDPRSIRRFLSLLYKVVDMIIDKQRALQVKMALKHIVFKSKPTGGEISALYTLAKRIYAALYEREMTQNE